MMFPTPEMRAAANEAWKDTVFQGKSAEAATEAAITAVIAIIPGEPVAVSWVDSTGCEHVTTDVERGESTAAAAGYEVCHLYASPAPLPVAVKAQNPYGHWVKHRLADGAFIPADCYVPSGPDYTVVPLYTHGVSSVGETDESYQARVAKAHGPLFDDDPTDIAERRARFFEEANETCQAFGMSREEAHALVDYTYGRPVGEPKKEVGAAMVTLTSLCVVAGVDLMECAEADLEKLQRSETIERIRAKRSTRHGRGPLPGLDPSASPTPASDIAALREKADAFDRIVTARGKYVDATAVYNARLELVQAERNRGNWSLKTDPEYRDMCDAQKAFIVSAQTETDAALQHVAKGERG